MSHWEAIYRSAWIILGVLFAIGILCMFWPQFRQYQEYQRREAELSEEIRLEQEIIRHLQRQQERIQHDPRFAEHVAHEMGLAQPEETIFKFVDDRPATAPRTAHEDR
ncbi:MAG: septum formation initiator family protein [Kiritimatiellae bacterium]|nr:septum formation initiator family protein [Kiritimatiellia bacterium]